MRDEKILFIGTFAVAALVIIGQTIVTVVETLAGCPQ